jgi:hypothetical protein
MSMKWKESEPVALGSHDELDGENTAELARCDVMTTL